MASYHRVFHPKFFHLFQKGRYSKERFASDLVAGVIVGIIALPLAIAFGIASGVTPGQGLVTAIVAGFLVSLLGGSRFLIGGPTGAFIVVITGITAKYGFAGLTAATFMAGGMLVVMGFCRLGIVFKFIPYPIVVGFTSGIALTIFTTQVKDFLGMQGLAVPSGFLPQWQAYLSHLSLVRLPEAAMGVGSLLVIMCWNRYVTKRVPGALVALVLGTLASLLLGKFMGVELATIGSRFPDLLQGGLSFPAPKLPAIEVGMLRDLFSPAFTIAMLCAIESLLAAMVADGATGKQHDSNTELIAQGIANLATPLFGGIPATGALARTMASISNGARTSVAGLVHVAVLLLIYFFLMPYVVYVPLACLAAILVVVAYNMSEWRSFRYLLRGDRSDVAVLLLTFLLTVLVDLTVAIELGILLSIVLFVRRIMQTSSIRAVDQQSLAATEDDDLEGMEEMERLDIHPGVEVYEINGPYFFGLASRSEDMEAAQRPRNVCRILRMRKVPFIDATGVRNLRALWDRARARGVQVILSGVQPEVLRTLEHFGLDREIGREHIFDNILPALSHANELADRRYREQ